MRTDEVIMALQQFQLNHISTVIPGWGIDMHAMNIQNIWRMQEKNKKYIMSDSLLLLNTEGKDVSIDVADIKIIKIKQL
jgi:hypothetical protein